MQLRIAKVAKDLRVYLAGKFETKPALVEYAKLLEEIPGIRVTSRWLSDDHKFSSGNPNIHADENRKEAENEALVDLADIRHCDVMVVIGYGCKEGTSGRSFEAGYATALGKYVIYVGDPEHIFGYLPGALRCTRFDTVEILLRGLLKGVSR